MDGTMMASGVTGGQRGELVMMMCSGNGIGCEANERVAS